MKMTIEVECSPEEARAFLGLPNVAPLNDMMVREMSNRLEDNMQLMNPEAMIKNWMAMGLQSQDAFMKLMTTAAGGAMKTFGQE